MEITNYIVENLETIGGFIIGIYLAIKFINLVYQWCGGASKVIINKVENDD